MADQGPVKVFSQAHLRSSVGLSLRQLRRLLLVCNSAGSLLLLCRQERARSPRAIPTRGERPDLAGLQTSRRRVRGAARLWSHLNLSGYIAAAHHLAFCIRTQVADIGPTLSHLRDKVAARDPIPANLAEWTYSTSLPPARRFSHRRWHLQIGLASCLHMRPYWATAGHISAQRNRRSRI